MRVRQTSVDTRIGCVIPFIPQDVPGEDGIEGMQHSSMQETSPFSRLHILVRTR